MKKADFLGVVLALIVFILCTSAIKGQGLDVTPHGVDDLGYVYFKPTTHEELLPFNCIPNDIEKIKSLKFTSTIYVDELFSNTVDGNEIVRTDWMPASIHFFYLPNQNSLSKTVQRFVLINDDLLDEAKVCTRLYWVTGVKKIKETASGSFTVEYTLEDRDIPFMLNNYSFILQNHKMKLYVSYENLNPIAVSIMEERSIFNTDKHETKIRTFGQTWVSPIIRNY